MFLSSIAARVRQGGLTEVTLQWLMVLFGAKCVFIGAIAAVSGQLTSVFLTVEDFTFTNLRDHLIVLCVTVATELPLHQVGTHLSASNNSVRLSSLPSWLLYTK